ncbi:hypothetical protein [Nonomuraea rosea]|uniref:hypothetical protein n=1 Tax=Nonomuraea rosea TaxID=638574 RepID=UPI0031E61E60
MGDRLRTIGVRFGVTEYGADVRRSTVLMDVEADGDEVVALVSVQLRADGRLVSWTRWHAGHERMVRWDAGVRGGRSAHRAGQQPDRGHRHRR